MVLEGGIVSDSEDELPLLSPVGSKGLIVPDSVPEAPPLEVSEFNQRKSPNSISRPRRRIIDDDSLPESLKNDSLPGEVGDSNNVVIDPPLEEESASYLSTSSREPKRRRTGFPSSEDKEQSKDSEHHGRYNLRKRTVEQKYIFTLDRLRNQSFQNERIRYADDEESDEYVPDNESPPDGSSPASRQHQNFSSDSDGESDSSSSVSTLDGDSVEQSLYDNGGSDQGEIERRPVGARRVKTTLPASKSAHPERTNSFQVKQSNEQKEKEQQRRVRNGPQKSSATSRSLKPRGSGDPSERLPKKPSRISVVDVASHYGSGASRALKVAARTARSRGSRVDESPNRKLFSGNNEAQRTLNKWKKGSLSLKHLQPRRYRTNEVSHKRPGSARTNVRSRKSHELSTAPQQYHTPIIEIPVTSSHIDTHDSGKSRSKKRRSDVASSKPKKSLSPRSRGLTVSHHDLRNIGFFSHLKFNLSTMYGSNTLDLLDAPLMWTVETGPMGFGCDILTSQDEINASIKDIMHVMKGDAGDIDLQLYDSIYAWLLRLVGHYIDDRQIVEPAVRRHVAHSLAQLAHNVAGLQTTGLRTPLKLVVILASALFTKGASKRDLRSLHDFFITQKAAAKVIFDSLDEIIREINASSHKSVVGRLYPGLELLLMSKRLGILTDPEKIDYSWPLILILAEARKPDYDWKAVRRYTRPPLLSLESSRIALQGCIKLMTICDWPPCVDVVIDFFLWHAKHNHYADPRGEYIGLPDFLWTDHPVDWDAPEYHLYLHLLAITLSKLRANGDISGARRVYNRVNPLGTLSFPETEPVTVSRLSQASQQYGTLLVILRHGVPECRPSVLQIRELVQLRGSHAAIRLKAVSAWAATTYIIGHEEAEECRNWLKDLAIYSHWEDHDVWNELARKSESLVRSGYHVICPELFLGLVAQPLRVQRRMWSLISVLVDRHATRDLRECVAGPLLGHFSKVEPTEYDVSQWIPVALILDLVEWPNDETRPLLFAGLVFKGTHIVEIVTEALRGTVSPTWLYEPRLYAAISENWGGIQSQWTAKNRKPLMSVFVSFLAKAGRTKQLSDALVLAKGYYRSSETSTDYENTVVRPLRRLIFEHVPSMAASHRWFDDSHAMDVEVALFQLRAPQRHLLWFLSQKLRRSLVFDRGRSFVEDISDAWLSISTPGIAVEAFDNLVDALIMFFKLALWHMSILIGVLPLAVQVIRRCIDGSSLPVSAEKILVAGFKVLNWCIRARVPASTILHCELYELGLSQLRYEWIHQHKTNIHIGLWSYDWRLRRFQDGFLYRPPHDPLQNAFPYSAETVQPVYEAVSGIDFVPEDPPRDTFEALRHRLRDASVAVEIESDLDKEVIDVLDDDSAEYLLVPAQDPMAWIDDSEPAGVGWRPVPNI